MYTHTGLLRWSRVFEFVVCKFSKHTVSFSFIITCSNLFINCCPCKHAILTYFLNLQSKGTECSLLQLSFSMLTVAFSGTLHAGPICVFRHFLVLSCQYYPQYFIYQIHFLMLCFLENFITLVNTQYYNLTFNKKRLKRTNVKEQTELS